MLHDTGQWKSINQSKMSKKQSRPCDVKDTPVRIQRLGLHQTSLFSVRKKDSIISPLLTSTYRPFYPTNLVVPINPRTLPNCPILVMINPPVDRRPTLWGRRRETPLMTIFTFSAWMFFSVQNYSSVIRLWREMIDTLQWILEVIIWVRRRLKLKLR